MEWPMIVVTFQSLARTEQVQCPRHTHLIFGPNVLRCGNQPIAEYRNLMWWVNNLSYTSADIAADVRLHFISPGQSALLLGPCPSLRLASGYLYANDVAIASLTAAGKWQALVNGKHYESIVAS
jgi:hypothetical protein